MTITADSRSDRGGDIERMTLVLTGKQEVIRRRALDRIGDCRRMRREVVSKSASGRSSIDFLEARFWTSEQPTIHPELWDLLQRVFLRTIMARTDGSNRWY